MKKYGLSAVVLSLTLLVCSCASIGNTAMNYERNELLQDFSQFRTVIENKTAGLYSDKAELRDMLDRTEAQIEEQMSEFEFYRLLAPIVSVLRCGHSFLSVSEATEKYMLTEAVYFPFEVRIKDNNLYVISDPYDTGIPPGTEILFINDEPAESVIERILLNMPTDGEDEGRPRYDAERWFASMYYGYIGSPEKFKLELAAPGSSDPYSELISAVRDPSLAVTSMGVVHGTANSPSEFRIGDGYAYAEIPTFSYNDLRSFENKLEDFFGEIKITETEDLIIDLRGNYGGTPGPTAALFQYLIREPTRFFSDNNPFYLFPWKKEVMPAPGAFDGRLYVLMDEAGFSMNSFLLSLLKYHDIGLLLGTQSSGGFKCSDASVNTVLYNTGLRFRYSTAIFQTEVEGIQSGVGIEPDICIEWEIEDYMDNRDPVLEAAIMFIERGGRP